MMQNQKLFKLLPHMVEKKLNLKSTQRKARSADGLWSIVKIAHQRVLSAVHKKSTKWLLQLVLGPR